MPDVEQQVELYLENKTLEDENRGLMETFDSVQIQFKELEKKYKKQQKMNTAQAKLI